jgi:hypothetical protein
MARSAKQSKKTFKKQKNFISNKKEQLFHTYLFSRESNITCAPHPSTHVALVMIHLYDPLGSGH